MSGKKIITGRKNQARDYKKRDFGARRGALAESIIADGYQYAEPTTCDRHHGDPGGHYLTREAKEALEGVTDSVHEYSDPKALRNIAAFCKDMRARKKAVDVLEDSEMLTFVAITSEHLDSAVSAVEKLEGDISALKKVAWNPKSKKEVVDIAVESLRGHSNALKNLAINCRTHGGRAALQTFCGDHKILMEIHKKTPLRLAPSGPPARMPWEEPRREQVRELLAATGGIIELVFVVSNCKYPKSEIGGKIALGKLEGMLPDLNDKKALNLIAEHSSHDEIKKVAKQKLDELKGPLERMWVAVCNMVGGQNESIQS